MRTIFSVAALAAFAGLPLSAQTVAAPAAATPPATTAAPATTTTTTSTATTTTTPAAELTVGATVKGSEGAAAGTIEAIEADMVTVKLTSGSQARIPKAGLRPNADGTATLGLTAAALEAQVKATATDTKPAAEAPKKK